MNRDEKTSEVNELKETFSKAQFAVVTDYRGLKVTQLETLRRSLRAENAQIRVAKNTLLRLAVQGTEYEKLAESFTGTTAVALSFSEPVGAAKALAEFAKDNEKLQIRCAALEGKLLTGDDVIALSKLPSKDQMRAMFLGVLLAVPTGFVRVLNGVPQKFVYLLQAIKEQKEN